MRRPRLWLVIIANVVTVLILSRFLGPSRREREIQTHLRILEDATYSLFPARNWREALTWKRIRARFHRGSFHKDAGSTLEEERNKLVELGYFERRTLTLANANLMSAFSTQSQATAFRDMNWSYSTKGGTNITLTAFTGDLPRWEQIVSNLNLQASNAQPR